MALESEDSKQITNSVIDILNACILTKGIDITKLATFDIEYLFLNVRSKSVGETIDVLITCPDDNTTKVETKIDRKHKDIIKIDDNISIKFKYPSMDSFIENNFESNEKSEVRNTLDMITSCMDVIFNEEESWNASESTKKELEDFIDQLNTKQFKQIEDFFSTMPKLTHSIKVKNPNTGVESSVILEGLAAFFN